MGLRRRPRRPGERALTNDEPVRRWLEVIEAAAGSADETAAGVAYLAASGVAFPPEQLRAAVRRAMLVLASGGDPRRALGVDAPAVGSLAADLYDVERRRELAASLGRLAREAHGLAAVTRALDALIADAELAWRWLACALLADELDDEEG